MDETNRCDGPERRSAKTLLGNRSVSKKLIIRTTGRRTELQDQNRLAPEPLRNDHHPQLTLVDLPIATLKLPNRRVRRAVPAQIERLKESIQRFGFVQPVLITAGRVIVDGWLGVEAAQKGRAWGGEKM